MSFRLHRPCPLDTPLAVNSPLAVNVAHQEAGSLTWPDRPLRLTLMTGSGVTARPAVTALLLGVGLLLALLALGLRAGTLAMVGGLVLAPGFWWRWKTAEFRRGVRELRRGNRHPSESHFRRFIQQTERDAGFLRYQPFFNLGRPYDYVAAAQNNLGVLALSSGDRESASREFEAALARSPGFPSANYGRAAVSLLGGDLEGAERAAAAGLEAQPDHRPCALLLALCHAERGDRPGAEAVLSDLRKPPSWDEARALWAKMYRLWGAGERAAEWH